MQWLEDFKDDAERQVFFENYWSGNPMNGDPRFEYMLEGIIVPTNKAQIEDIRQRGAKLSSFDSGSNWRDLDGLEYKDWFVEI